jgi:hypothetical protein
MSAQSAAKQVSPPELTQEEATYGKRPNYLSYQVRLGHDAGNSLSCGHRALTALKCWGRKNLEEIKASNPPDMERAQAYWARKDMIERINQFSPGMTFIFSDADIFGNGLNLANWIRERGLGMLTEHGPIKNPNSGNMIRFWMWTYTTAKVPRIYEVRGENQK